MPTHLTTQRITDKTINNNKMSMYVRIKRRNQTVFLHVEPSNSFLQIKQRLAETFNMEPAQILLYASDKKKEFVDAATVSDQEVKNDDIVYMVFPKEAGGGFEDIQADNLLPMGEDS